MLPALPLSPAAAATEAAVLAIPVTHEPLDDELPPGLPADENERLYYGAVDGEAWVVPALKKAIARFPELPALKNYLSVALRQRGQNRQAHEVLKQILAAHPDYLFGRLGLAEEWLDAGNPEKAAEALGGGLDLRKLYPERNVFHFSEVKHFHTTAATILFQTGEIDRGLGILAALRKLAPGDPANVKRWQRMLEAEKNQRVEVKAAALPKASPPAAPPDFQHPEIHALYEHGLELPESLIRGILALPRESVVGDLIAVLRDGIANTSWYMQEGEDEETAFFPFHALHLLGELAATEALPAVLDFHSLPGEALRFWMGDFSHSWQIAAICSGGLPEVAAWLKRPGIAAAGKSTISSALVVLAARGAEERARVLAIFRDTLEFMLASPPADNVVDTSLVSSMVGDVMDLRAAEFAPLIERLWEKRLILRSVNGELESILGELDSPPPQAKGEPAEESMIARYRRLVRNQSTENGESPYGFDSFANQAPGLPTAAAKVGRNDPCPCGSGKKHKKCCLGK